MDVPYSSFNQKEIVDENTNIKMYVLIVKQTSKFSFPMFCILNYAPEVYLFMKNIIITKIQNKKHSNGQKLEKQLLKQKLNTKSQQT